MKGTEKGLRKILDNKYKCDMNETSNIIAQQEHEFAEVISIIQQHRSTTSRLVNEELLLTAWHVGGYVIVQP